MIQFLHRRPELESFDSPAVVAAEFFSCLLGYPNGVCGSPFAVDASTRAADAHAAMASLAGLPFVDKEWIAVMGMSHGGWTTLMAVENTYLIEMPRANPFKAAVALYPHCGPQLYRLDAPLLILIGEADDWTFAFRCERMEMKGPSRHSITLKVYPGATHSFDVDRPDREYQGHTLKFHPSATRDAEARVRAFLGKHLN
jgi:dienelactone hydrolase